jgi:hypothetical protein
MCKELKYITELNYVLHFLATNPYAKGFITHSEIFSRLQATEMRMDGNKLLLYLNELEKDNYIHIEFRESIANYRISLEGLIHDELGGYNSLYLENNKIRNKLGY